MTTPPVSNRIDQTVQANLAGTLDAIESRHRGIDALVADLDLTDREASFALEEAKLDQELAGIATEAERELQQLGKTFQEATQDVEFFLAEHRLVRRPSAGSFTSLSLVTGLALLAEEAATAPIYAPAVGWPAAVAIAGLISIGVAAPAMLTGVGAVAARHRLSLSTSLGGVAGAFAGAALGAFSLACGAHFREALSIRPSLASKPSEAARAILESLMQSWFEPLFEPANAGLTAVGAIAWACTAYKAFHTFGYPGWRNIGLAEVEARDAVTDVGDQAQDLATTAVEGATAQVNRALRRSRRQMSLLRRVQGLDQRLRQRASTALVRYATLRGDAQEQVLRVIKSLAPRAAVAAAACPVAAVRRIDRTAFDTAVIASLDRHRRRIDDAPRVLGAMSQKYQASSAAIAAAIARALGETGARP